MGIDRRAPSRIGYNFFVFSFCHLVGKHGHNAVHFAQTIGPSNPISLGVLVFGHKGFFLGVETMSNGIVPRFTHVRFGWFHNVVAQITSPIQPRQQSRGGGRGVWPQHFAPLVFASWYIHALRLFVVVHNLQGNRSTGRKQTTVRHGQRLSHNGFAAGLARGQHGWDRALLVRFPFSFAFGVVVRFVGVAPCSRWLRSDLVGRGGAWGKSGVVFSVSATHGALRHAGGGGEPIVDLGGGFPWETRHVGGGWDGEEVDQLRIESIIVSGCKVPKSKSQKLQKNIICILPLQRKMRTTIFCCNKGPSNHLSCRLRILIVVFACF
jgi:hypothetical protein